MNKKTEHFCDNEQKIKKCLSCNKSFCDNCLDYQKTKMEKKRK